MLHRKNHAERLIGMVDQQIARFTNVFQRNPVRGHGIDKKTLLGNQSNQFPCVALRGELDKCRRIILPVSVCILSTSSLSSFRPSMG